MGIAFAAAIAAAGGAAVLGAAALDRRLQVTYHTVRSLKLPKAFDGFKIVHLSDFHNDRSVKPLEAIKKENPDLIVFTGDIADDKNTFLPALELVGELQKIASCLMVTGNHDLWREDFEEMESAMTETGARFLRNEQTFVEKDGEKISVCGIDDPSGTQLKKIKESIARSSEELPRFEGYELLLFHRANLLDEVSHLGFDLILSGHMHGGHMRMPGIGGIMSPRTSWVIGGNVLFPKYCGGRFECEKTSMIVSRGMGNPMIIPRIFNRPEIIVIKLIVKEQ